jgi:parvulin-like peptidyl-prolyl isomerase
MKENSMNLVKKMIYYMLIFLFYSPHICMSISEDLSRAYVIDRIEIVVFGDDNTKVITQSDLERPGIDGSVRSRHDLVLEQLMYDDAKRYKIVPDQEKIDKHLQAVQRENNLTHEQMEQIFRSAGYTFDEGKQQFGIMSAVNSIIDFRVKSRCMVIPEKIIKSYYESNPLYEPASYQLQYGHIICDQKLSPAELKKCLVRGDKHIVWNEPFWIEHKDVSPSRKFIFTMKRHTIVGPMKTASGFEFFKLVNKKEDRLLSLEERRADIINEIRKGRFQEVMDEYKKELLNDAAILYFD